MRTIRQAWVVFGICLAAGAAVGQQPLPNPDRINASFPTQQQAEAWVKECAPILEQITGRTFKQIPAVRIVSLMDMAELVSNDIMYISKLRGEDLESKLEDDFEKALDVYASSMKLAGTLMGKYSLKEKCLAIGPDVIDAVIKKHAVPADRQAGFLKLVCVHELAHALHDQQVDYARVAAALPDDLEMGRAYAALTEGFAERVQSIAAQGLQLDDENELVVASIASTHQVTGVPREGYTALVEFYYRDGGWNRVWTVLDHPTAELAKDLAQLSPGRAVERNNPYEAALNKVETKWGLECDRVVRTDGGAESVASIFARGMGSVRTKRIQGVIDHAYVRMCLRQGQDDVKHACLLTVYVLNDSTQAGLLTSAFPDVLKELHKGYTSGKPGQTGATLARTLASGDSRSVTVQTMQTVHMDANCVDQTMAWCTAGDAVVQLMTINEPLTDAKIVEILDAVVETIEE